MHLILVHLPQDTLSAVDGRLIPAPRLSPGPLFARSNAHARQAMLDAPTEACVIMETQRLRTVQHPARVGDLLDSLLGTQQMIPPGLIRVVSASLLPAPLRVLSRCIERRDGAWRAWTDGARVWFFEALLSLALSRERGKPVIQLKEYDEVGDLERVMTFVSTAAHGWQRCA